jgi:uncharacterized protein
MLRSLLRPALDLQVISGFQPGGLIGSEHSTRGQAGRFLQSIDPEYAISRITPRPVWVLHATPDTVIPFDDGKRLAGRAGEPKQFIPFNGTHGINEEADRIYQGEGTHL